MHAQRGGHLALLPYLPLDDSVKGGRYSVKSVGTEYEERLSDVKQDFADTTHKDVCRSIQHMPTRYLSFHVCVTPRALPFEMDIEVRVVLAGVVRGNSSSCHIGYILNLLIKNTQSMGSLSVQQVEK